MNPNSRFPTLTLFISILTILLLTVITSQAQPNTIYGSAPLFQNQDSAPITGSIRLLCFASYTAPAPHADLTIEVTDGFPSGGPPIPDNCSHIAALHLRHTQPSGKHSQPAYWLYTTSWSPGSTRPYTATLPITIRDQWPLTVINLTASLAWQPAPNSPIANTNQLQSGLQAFSTELYDLTDGQMIIGPVQISTGGSQWNAADLRFLPANDKRPSAFVGGIVPDKLPYSGYLTDTIYLPAAATFGRLWDGRDAFDESSGPWNQPPAYRTIAHEWAHLGLFLYDEYQNTDGLAGSCICDALSSSGCGFGDRDASALAYHYTASEFWHKDTHLTVANFCYDTWQMHVHGQTDWDTLSNWHTIQGIPLPFTPLRSPVPQLAAGPAPGLAAHLFGRPINPTTYLPILLHAPETAVAPPQEPIVQLLAPSTAPPTSHPTQIYLLKDGLPPSRILPQGRATGDPSASSFGSLRLLDVRPTDRVRAYAQPLPSSVSAAGRYTVISDASPLTDIQLASNPWDITLEHAFQLQDSYLVTLTLSVRDEDGRLTTPMLQLCSLDTAVGCHPHWQKPLTATGGGWWQATYTRLPGSTELPRYLILRLWDAHDNAIADELVQWIQAAGGVGPTHKDGMAPLLDDVIMVNLTSPFANAGDCNLVSYTPATHAAALKAPLPLGIGGLIGIPLDVNITLNAQTCPTAVPGQPIPLPTNLLLNMAYSQDEVTRLGITEATEPTRLRILHYVPNTGWAIWQQVDTNTDLNWIATTTQEDGIYAIGWTP
jgi:hypothetical protein